MSEASSDQQLGSLRALHDDELGVIRKMLAGTSFEAEFDGHIKKMQVQGMADGGMGSIRFYNGRTRSSLDHGDEIAEAAFQDADSVPVSVTLSVGSAGELFELDVFKADFSPLIGYPDPERLATIKRDEQGNVISAL